MLKTRIEQSSGRRTLIIEGELTIDHAEELRLDFMQALESGDSLAIRVENVGKTDLFGLQVLCSAHQSAELSRKELTLAGKLPEALRDTIERSHFGRHAGCSAGAVCPWDRK